MCSNSPFMTFISRSNQSGYTWQPDCDGWACQECRPKLEKAWNEHFVDRVSTCPGGIGYLCVPDSKLPATMKRLARAGTQYIRVRGHGIFHVYTSNPTLGQKRLPGQQAVGLFAEHVALAPSGKGHVISTSRAWRRWNPAQVVDQAEPSDLKCIATRVGPEAIRGILAKLGQTYSMSGQTLSFRLDSADTIESFLSAVQAERSTCPYFPSDTKRRREISDNRPTAATGAHRLPANPAYDALRSP